MFGDDVLIAGLLLSLWGLGLLTLYAVACLIEWIGRVLLGIDWEAVWPFLFAAVSSCPKPPPEDADG